MFKKKAQFTFRKNKAIKSLCGVVIASGVLLSGHLVSADEAASAPVAETRVSTTGSESSLPNQAISNEAVEVPSNEAISDSTALAPKAENPASSQVTTNAEEPAKTEKLTETSNQTTDTTKAEESTAATAEASVMVQDSVKSEVSLAEPTTTEENGQSSNLRMSRTAPLAETTSVVQDGSKLTITYNEKMTADDKLAIAVWTQAGGQNDLAWYHSTTNSLVVDLAAKHKEYGLYNIHTYLNNKGKLSGKNAQTYTVEAPIPTVEVNKVSDDKYTVLVSNLGKEISSLSLPIWTEAGGQNDITWYGAKKTGEGTFSGQIQLKNHAYETGLYNIHVYGYSTITSRSEGLKATQYRIPERNIESSISLKDSETFSVSISNLPTFIKKIKLPTWTEAGGQNDLVWYDANKTKEGFAQDISIKKHNDETGRYNVHIYGETVDGQLIGLGAKTISVPQMTPKVKVISKGNNNYEVSITDVPARMKSISVPIWSEKGGQDDIVWNSATKKSPTSYVTTFSLQDHKNNIGLYNIHVYGRTDKGMVGLTSSTYTVEDLEVKTNPKYAVGQMVEIQPFAESESNGTKLKDRVEWIGTVKNIAKNTNNRIGGWEYHVVYANQQENLHVLEQDLKFVFPVNLKESNTKEQNNIALQQAFNYASANKDTTLYMPEGNFTIGSNIQETDLGKVSANEYIILSSNAKLKGNDKGTKLIVDGTMLWFGLPTGTRGVDGVSNLTLDNVHVQAKDLINGDYFMVQLNHGHNITVKNSSFTMVQRKSRHIFDLGGVQNATFTNNQFIGYAPELTTVTTIPSGANLHEFYAEVIQLDASSNSGVWDASMIKNIASNAYMAYNSSTPVLSDNISILNNQFLPYVNDGKIIAYSSTVGQHSSAIGKMTVVGNRFEKTLSRRYNHDSWVMKPIHYAEGSADIRNNTFL